jgi:hypothetical protein
MSAYPPPASNLTTFNTNVFSAPNDLITQAEADKILLQYPIGQGEETIPSLIISGTEQINGTLNSAANTIMTGTPAVNYIEYPDGSKQYTAYTAVGTATNANNVLCRNITTTGTYPISYLPVGTTTGTYQPNNFDSAGNHLTYNPSTNAFSVGGTTNGKININGTGGNLTIAGTGTAISCPNATAVSLPSANTTASALTCSTINHPSGVSLQYNGSTKLTTTNTGVDCSVIDRTGDIEIQYNGATKLSSNINGIRIYGEDTAIGLNYDPAIIGTSVGWEFVMGYNDYVSAAWTPTAAYSNVVNTTLKVGVYIVVGSMALTWTTSNQGNQTIFAISTSSAAISENKYISYACGNSQTSPLLNSYSTGPITLFITTTTTIYLVARVPTASPNPTISTGEIRFMRVA